MSSTAQRMPQRHPLSVADYYRMGETGILAQGARMELIDGEIIDMPPIGSTHAGTVDYLNYVLSRALGGRAIVGVQRPLRLDDYSEPEPDVMLLHLRPDFYTSAHPRPADVLLLIEVADTSLHYDRHSKLPLYAKHGIPEVWLVDIANQRLSVFRGPVEGTYQDVLDPVSAKSIAPAAFPEMVLNMADLYSSAVAGI